MYLQIYKSFEGLVPMQDAESTIVHKTQQKFVS